MTHPACGLLGDGRVRVGPTGCDAPVIRLLGDGVRVGQQDVDDPDVTPPVITLLGDGTMAMTSDGMILMIHNILLHGDFSDPGVTGYDTKDGDLTAEVSSFGAGAVNTASVTPTDGPYVISYNLHDAAGNAADEVRRRVYVYNPCDEPEEPICDGGGCTENGLCMSVTLGDDDATVAEDTPPVITLVGQATLEVAQGEPYTKCSEASGLADVCDKGATAVDEADGILDSQILACSPDGVSYKWGNKGVQNCKVDTGVPGNYLVRYQVFNSVGLSAEASRNITVVKSCPTGEKLCSSKTTCSTGGTCMDDLGGGSTEAVEDLAPTLTLLGNNFLSSSISVKQYSSYQACAAGVVPKDGKLCEMGAEAHDEESGNITKRVLSCPPTDCLDQGCPGHEFVTKGVDGCLSTSAEVGTIFQLQFIVFDEAIPSNTATVTRLITITQPCDDGNVWCAEFVGSECSSVDCETRAMLSDDDAPAADVDPPTITLLGAASLRITYGAAEDISILPCTSDAAASESTVSCYATALDATDGDVSASIKITQVSTSTGSACPAEQAPSAVCFPGVYTYEYTAQDQALNAASTQLVVEIVEVQLLESVLVVVCTAQGPEGAAAEAAALLNASSPENAALRAGVAAMLSSSDDDAALPVTADDVTVQNSTAVLDDTATWTVELGLIVEVVQAGQSAARRRRLRGEEESSLEDRTAKLAQALTQGSSGNGSEPAALTGFLQEAAAAENVTMSTESAGLASNVSTAAGSSDVDEVAAAHAELLALLSSAADSVGQSTVTMTEVRATLLAVATRGSASMASRSTGALCPRPLSLCPRMLSVHGLTQNAGDKCYDAERRRQTL
ncbi:hypothetical protein CYMTET_36504 [Cymbomonas tetramitiformis]|uniref:Pesticidal crystal protein Cry22Aa Ig-like domain-containing protein n=1 Tax=Cymbomonas tetramitiformis TaxID=36881 RepID=A0AAE0CI60_9CHLO|nr:hypothetical protein CYMTET_36504 [Cymbomonas tetramitiformis]